MCFTAIRKGSDVIVWNWIPSGEDPTLAFTCALSSAKTYDLIRLQRMSVSTNESQSVGRKWNSAVIYGFGWHLTKCHISVPLLLWGALVCTYNFPSFHFSNFAILANITKQGAQTFHVFMGRFHKTFITFFPLFWTRVHFCDWLSEDEGRCVRVRVLWELWLIVALLQLSWKPKSNLVHLTEIEGKYRMFSCTILSFILLGKN